jgi:diguanylate cyclase (GGDEF)-like protein
MPNPGDPTPVRPSPEDAFLDLLADTMEGLERPARGQFLQKFLRSIAHVDLSEAQSLDIWEQTLSRRRELTESLGRRIALQAALLDSLASANLLRLPIVMEYEDFQKLQINAATDPLTGLYNRRFFDDFFEKELNRAARYAHRLALVIFDLHRFKDVNDKYGHPQGDVMLQLAATTLRKSLRTSDYAFRTGGDEFALLLPQSDTEQAAALSRRMRAAYSTAIGPLHLGIPLALDYGLAVYPEDGQQREVLIRVADERLYQMKKAKEAPEAPPATRVQPPEEEEKARLPQFGVPGETAQIPGAAKAERRRWERVSLVGTRAYALIGEGVERTARVLDLGYGGVALETTHPEEFQNEFRAVLHVPILPPVRVTLRRVYRGRGSAGNARIGCAFVT